MVILLNRKKPGKVRFVQWEQLGLSRNKMKEKNKFRKIENQSKKSHFGLQRKGTIGKKLRGVDWVPLPVRIYTQVFPLVSCQFNPMFSINFTFQCCKVRGVIQASAGINILFGKY